MEMDARALVCRAPFIVGAYVGTLYISYQAERKADPLSESTEIGMRTCMHSKLVLFSFSLLALLTSRLLACQLRSWSIIFFLYKTHCVKESGIPLFQQQTSRLDKNQG